jgi:hypothetical protein
MPRTSRPLWLAALVPLALAASLLPGCGGSSPPSAQVHAEIEKAMTEGRQAVEPRGITLASWKNEVPYIFNTTWTGKLRLKEDHAYIVAIADGKNIVKVVGKAGDELDMSGGAAASKPEGARDWTCGANADIGESGAWAKLAAKDGPVPGGYPVIDGEGNQTGTKFRAPFAEDFVQPLSAFKPYIVQGSDEDKALGAQIAARRQKAMEAQAARVKAQQDAQAAEAARRQAEAAERQRQLTEKAAADQKAREEAAAKQAEAARVARLSPVLAPFKGGKGAVLTTDAGPEMGAFLYDVAVDEANFKVTGKGLDLREMPFKEFTFECAAADNAGRASFSFTRSGAEPLALSPTPTGLGARGVALAALSEVDRAKLDALASRGRALAGAAPLTLTVETLDAKAAAARPAEAADGIAGTVIYKGKVAPQVAGLFTTAGTRGSAWKSEPVAIRLKDPARAKAILIKGANPTDHLTVVINGVHKATIASIEKLGAAVVTLPPDLELMDLRLEATGAASARSVTLVK